MRCNQFGCECCTCLECNNYKESCVCDVRAKAREWIGKNSWQEDLSENIREAIKIMEDLGA
jgi:hypothetical protein